MATRVAVVRLALLALLGCSEATPASPRRAPPPPARDGAMCATHGVLAALCTACEPALIPVFRAKGDFCAEHGLPESICPICHPERGGRPAVSVAGGAAGPAEGTRVRLKSADTVDLAGLETVRARERPLVREVVATARVVYDATRVAELNPRMPGVVKAIAADVGAAVRAGQVLARIESAGVGVERSRLQSARTRLEVAESNHARIERLRADGISPENDLLAARREREEARAELQSAEAALGMVGARPEGRGEYELVTPIAGVVTRRGATIGRLVDVDDLAFEVVDPREMWIELDVPEDQLAGVAVGQSARVTLDGLPGRELAGVLTYVAPAVDVRTRTAVARLPAPNPDGELRANLFGQGRIAVTARAPSVLVPASAVQRARDVHVVFVKLAEDRFEARRVVPGFGADGWVSVAGRVAAGDEVVTRGSFLLKTETLKDALGAGCCEVE